MLKEHGPTRDDVMAWAREETRLETLKYSKEEHGNKAVQISEYGRQNFFRKSRKQNWGQV